MKKIFYLYILIFLSCDPGWFGLEEEAGIFSYHDGLALAWEVFFSEQDYDTAIAYVNMSINETEDEEYDNSAYTALGWLYLFKSNIFFGTESDSLIAIYRESALSEFLYIENEQEAINGYSTGCYYDFCCSNCFAKDRELGLLYMQIEEYFILPDATTDINALISQLASFVNDNDGLDNDGLEVDDEVEYNFMNGKPIGNDGETIDFAIDDVKVYLAHIYFRNGDFTKSCNELKTLPEQFPDDDYEDCKLKCDPDGGWDNNNLDDLLDCFNSQTLF